MSIRNKFFWSKCEIRHVLFKERFEQFICFKNLLFLGKYKNFILFYFFFFNEKNYLDRNFLLLVAQVAALSITLHIKICRESSKKLLFCAPLQEYWNNNFKNEQTSDYRKLHKLFQIKDLKNWINSFFWNPRLLDEMEVCFM